MLGKKIEFVDDKGTIQQGIIAEINGESVIVKDERDRLWQGSLSQLISKMDRPQDEVK